MTLQQIICYLTPIMTYHSPNPFFVSLTLQCDSSKLSRALALCRVPGKSTPMVLFHSTLSPEDVVLMQSSLTLVPCNIKWNVNKVHHQCSIMVSKTHLEPYNNLSLSLFDEELVFVVPELDASVIPLYNQLYAPSMNFENIFNLISMFQYFNCHTCPLHTGNQLTNLMTLLQETQHFRNPWNCKINIDHMFVKRCFAIRDPHLEIPNMDTLDSAAKEFIDMAGGDFINGNYMNDTDLLVKRQVILDNDDGIVDPYGNKRYKIYSLPLKISQIHVVDLFRSLSNEKDLYYTFNMFLMSKSYCHMVLNNVDVLNKMTPLFDKYLPILRLTVGYAFLCLSLEESICKTRATKDSRFVIPLSVAEKLPIFPYSCEDIHMNPYAVLLVNKSYINFKANLQGIAPIKNYQHYGVCDLDSFVGRLNIFLTGSRTLNIFKDWEKENNRWKYCAISGSSMAACIPKRSPLMDLHRSSNRLDDDMWNRYFDEYYPIASSDVDVEVYAERSIFKFLDIVANCIIGIQKQLTDVYSDVEPITILPKKTLSIIVHTNYIKQFMTDDSYEVSLQKLKDNKQNMPFKEKFIALYTKVKTERNQRLSDSGHPISELYEKYMQMMSIGDLRVVVVDYYDESTTFYETDGDMCFRHNDLCDADHRVENADNRVLLKISEDIKIKVESPRLLRCLEFFQIKYPDFWAITSKFHFGIVRAYYDGEMVYMLPSFISSVMTFMNYGYRYFASTTTNPCHLILKIWHRGYGVVLNDTERIQLKKYLETDEQWKEMVHDRGSMINIFGPRKLDSKIYKPGRVRRGFPEDVYSKPMVDYELVLSDFKKAYDTRCGYATTNMALDLFAFRTINIKGQVEPFQPWLLDGAYEEINKLTGNH